MNKGVELWKRAKQLIPGGNQLLSKRSEMFLPGLWPSYYSKAAGVNIWDLDGNKYTDMTIMGVGTCILGYSDPDVNQTVIDAVSAGNMGTLNAPEEVELAEKLIKMNPWAGMVRYARTGGEAMAIAVRIARASSKKDKIAFTGYHGWHDWYLSANLAKGDNLDAQLLAGLSPLGVPTALHDTAIPFYYNHYNQLEEITENHDIGVIIVESVRDKEPEDNFLKKVRKLADETNSVLVFDEITSGFRVNVGGAYTKYGVNPDIVVYAKAMGNGFPMAAIVGKSEVMDIAQESFISSTYWTDKIGPTAALATIAKMEDNKVPNHLIKIGTMISEGWMRIARDHDINLIVSGMKPLVHFTIKEKDSQALRTLFTQELLDASFLASSSVYVSFKHTEEIVERYLEEFDRAFSIISNAKDKGNVMDLLKGGVAHSGFERLT